MNRRKYLSTIGALTLTAGCAGDADTDETPPTTTTTDGPPMHEMGETFTVGDGATEIEYQTTDAFAITDAIGSAYAATDPDGMFVVVTLEMENVGDESLDITTNHLKLVDDQARTFEADTEALTYATNDPRIEADAIMFDQLQPGLSVTRSIIFDVPSEGGYGLMVDPAGVFSTAESHVVLLRPSETTEQ